MQKIRLHTLQKERSHQKKDRTVYYFKFSDN